MCGHDDGTVASLPSFNTASFPSLRVGVGGETVCVVLVLVLVLVRTCAVVVRCERFRGGAAKEGRLPSLLATWAVIGKGKGKRKWKWQWNW